MGKHRIQFKRMSRTATGGGLGMALCLLMCLPAPGQSPGAVDALYPPSRPSPPAQKAEQNVLTMETGQAEKSLAQIEKRLDTIEARLGKTSRPPSIAYNVERRLSDLERRLQKLEQQQARMQKWEQRIRRLEMK